MDNPRIPFIFDSPISDWDPAWVYAGKTQDQEALLEKDRKRRIKEEPCAFLGNVMSELLTLWSIGEIPLPAVLGKTANLIKIIDERGLKYTATYYAAERSMKLLSSRQR